MSEDICCSEGACSKCYDGPVTDIQPRTDAERYDALVKMEKEAHAEAVTQTNAPAVRASAG